MTIGLTATEVPMDRLSRRAIVPGMDTTADPQNADLRELLVAVAGDLERLACTHPEHAERFLARAMRLRRRSLHSTAGP